MVLLLWILIVIEIVLVSQLLALLWYMGLQRLIYWLDDRALAEWKRCRGIVTSADDSITDDKEIDL